MIELYVSRSCPFCRRVLAAADELGMVEGTDYLEVDAAPGTPGRETVVERGGKAMIPFLIDGPTAMYESSDIVAYLKERFPRS